MNKVVQEKTVSRCDCICHDEMRFFTQGMVVPLLGPAHHDAKLEALHGPPRAAAVNLMASHPVSEKPPRRSGTWPATRCETITGYKL